MVDPASYPIGARNEDSTCLLTQHYIPAMPGNIVRNNFLKVLSLLLFHCSECH